MMLQYSLKFSVSLFSLVALVIYIYMAVRLFRYILASLLVNNKKYSYSNNAPYYLY